MANWLCLYTITVSPVYWFVSQFSCLVTGSTFRDDSDFFGLEVLLFLLTFIVSLSVAIVLLVGGLRLRALRASGVTWLKIGLSADLILPIVIGILALVVSAVASETDFRQSTTGQDLVGFVVMTLGFSLYLFEVFGLIWLHRHAALLGSLKNR